MEVNQDIYEVFLSRDEDKNPFKILNIFPDVYRCLICADWLGIEIDTMAHSEIHPPQHCSFCNRLMYIVDVPDNPFKGSGDPNGFICSVCYRNALKFRKTWAYKWAKFKNRLRNLMK